MSKSSAIPALDELLTATTGRNMTKGARVAVVCGVVAMVLLTVDPAYQALHYPIDIVLGTCLVFFVFEWVIGFVTPPAPAADRPMSFPFAGWWMRLPRLQYPPHS